MQDDVLRLLAESEAGGLGIVGCIVARPESGDGLAASLGQRTLGGDFVLGRVPWLLVDERCLDSQKESASLVP